MHLGTIARGPCHLFLCAAVSAGSTDGYDLDDLLEGQGDEVEKYFRFRSH